MALLIGAVGGILLTLVLGTARITRLRQVRRPKGDTPGLDHKGQFITDIQETRPEYR